MIKVYADGVLTYDSRLEEQTLQGLSLTLGNNKGGTATIAMPPDHPGYDAYTLYKTIVEVYRDSKILFRGRPIQRADDVYKQRVITCEGELCFFQDAVSRPYIYQEAPSTIFRELVNAYNSQVEEAKRFEVGVVTLADNTLIKLESETAESILDTLNKLLERCGGYIVFTTSADSGGRVVSWHETMGHRSSQVIEFGENLLDFSRNGANTGLLTAVLPYGAKDEATGLRVTIESVNDGLDYIVDEEARDLRGFIIKPVYWEDVTVPLNLLRKAQQYLEQNRHIITGLQLTALDLSYMDKSIDSFQVGDYIRVVSKPHNVDEDFFLTDIVLDLLNPAGGSISLGKELATLTDADVAGDRNNRGELHKVAHQIRADYTLGIANTVQETELILTSLIEQTSEAIKQEVSQTYTTNDQLTEAVSTSMTQFKDQFLFEFESIKAVLDANDAEAREHFNEIYHYISFEGGAIKLGASDSAITLSIENDLIIFRKNGAQFGWWDGVDFHTGNIVVEVNERAQFGNFAFVPRSNGSLSFLKVEG